MATQGGSGPAEIVLRLGEHEGQNGSCWAGRHSVDSDLPVARALGLGSVRSCWRLLHSVHGHLTWHPRGTLEAWL